MKSDSFDLIYSKVDSLKSDCKDMTVPELKGELGDRNLELSGRKTFLVKRLIKAKIRELLVSKTNKDLRLELKNKGLSVSGTKDEKIDKLTVDIIGSKSDKSSISKDVDYSKMTVSQLKKELNSKGQPVSGKKSELIKRLRTFDNSVDYSRMTVKELRVELRNQGKPVSGNKKMLIVRLKSPETTLTYNYMTVKELRELLKSQGLTVSGNKAYLVSKLQASDRNSVNYSELPNYSGLPSDYAYAMGGDDDIIVKAIAGVIGIFLFVGFIGFVGLIFAVDSSYDDDYYDDDYYSSPSSSSSYDSGSSSSSSSSDCYYYSSYKGGCMTQAEYNCYFVTGGCDLASLNYGSGGNSYSSGSSSYNSGTSSSSSNCDAYMAYDSYYDVFYLYDPCTGDIYIV